MSCFICLDSTEPQHYSWIPGNLKRLLVKTTQLLKLEGILDEDWDFLEGSQGSVCCLKCNENLETIVKAHEILVKSKEKLKECLERVETVVGNSVKPEVDEVASLWGPGCFKFRDQLKIRNQDPFLHNDYNPPKEVGEVEGTSEGRLSDPHGDLMSGVESTQDPLGQTKGRRKRRNIVVIAEEDNLDDHKLPLIIKRRKSSTGSCIGDEDWPEGASESESDVDRESDFDLPMSSGNDDEEDVKKTNERDKDSCQRTTFGVDCCRLQFSNFKAGSKHAFSRRHKIGIHGTKPNKCDLCSKTLRGRQTLQRHRARFHGNKPVPKLERSWDCDMCREKVMQTNTRQHVENHVCIDGVRVRSENVTPKQPSTINRPIPGPSKRKNQQKSDESLEDKKEYVCEICKGKFDTVRSYREHRKLHPGSKPFACKERGCTKKFAFIYDMETHVRTAHRDEKFPCGICSKRFVSKYSVQRHKRSRHPQSK